MSNQGHRRNPMLRKTLLLLWVAWCGGCGTSTSSSGAPDGGGSDAKGVDGATDAKVDGATDATGVDGPGGCPVTEPAAATGVSTVPCTEQGLSCPYGCTGCVCNQGYWSCSSPGCVGPAPCPDTAPAEGSACSPNGGCCGGQQTPCTYTPDAGSVTATCTGSVWQVTASAADSGTD
jgi:hypothetical protein